MQGRASWAEDEPTAADHSEWLSCRCVGEKATGKLLVSQPCARTTSREAAMALEGTFQQTELRLSGPSQGLLTPAGMLAGASSARHTRPAGRAAGRGSERLAGDSCQALPGTARCCQEWLLPGPWCCSHQCYLGHPSSSGFLSMPAGPSFPQVLAHTIPAMSTVHQPPSGQCPSQYPLYHTAPLAEPQTQTPAPYTYCCPGLPKASPRPTGPFDRGEGQGRLTDKILQV